MMPKARQFLGIGCAVSIASLVFNSSALAAPIVFDAAAGASAIAGYIAGSDPTASGTAYTHPSFPVGQLVDGNLATRIDTYSGSEVSPFGNNVAPYDYVGVMWGSSVDQIVAVRLHQFIYFDGGWLGTSTGDTFSTNSSSPPFNSSAANAADAADVAPPSVQITMDSGATWIDIASTEDYVSIVQPYVASNFIGLVPTPITFEFAAQSGINGLRLVGYGGGRSDVIGGRDEQGWVSAAEFEVGRLETSVPGPGALILFGAGLIGLAGLQRRRD